MDDFTPIARLETIILDAVDYDRSLGSKIVWGNVFDYNYRDRRTVTDYAYEYFRLVDHVELNLKVLKKGYADSKPSQSSVLTLRELVFGFNQDIQWDAYKRTITDGVLILLETGRDLYVANSLNAEQKVGDEYLEELKSSLEELFQSVFYSDLTRELRLKLCADISQMLNAVKFYQLRGADGLQEGMSLLVGRYAFNTSELNKEEAKEVRNKFKNVFSKFFAAMSHANTLHQFLENAPDFVKKLVDMS